MIGRKKHWHISIKICINGLLQIDLRMNENNEKASLWQTWLRNWIWPFLIPMTSDILDEAVYH